MNYINVLVVVCVLLVAWIIWSAFVDKNIETPKYSVIENKRKYEIRKYETHVVAEVSVDGNFSDGTSKAFLKLARYIFGGNSTKEKIAMTAPVLTAQKNEKITMTTPVSTSQNNDELTMSFMMPSKYTLESLPIPDSDEIKFREIPSSTYAVKRFTGWVSDSVRSKQTKKLLNDLSIDGVEVSGEPVLLQYDRPFKFPFLRRNEIKVGVVV